MNVLVMLPTGTREEAEQARRAFAAHGLGVHFGWAGAHTRGQTIRGEVVVFSKADEERLKADAERLHRVDGLKQCDKAARKIAGQPDQPAKPEQPVEPAPEPASAEQPDQSKLKVEHAVARWFNVVDESGNVLRERVSREEAEEYVRTGGTAKPDEPDSAAD